MSGGEPSRSQTPVWERRSAKLPFRGGPKQEFRRQAFPNGSLGTRASRVSRPTPSLFPNALRVARPEVLRRAWRACRDPRPSEYLRACHAGEVFYTAGHRTFPLKQFTMSLFLFRCPRFSFSRQLVGTWSRHVLKPTT